MSKKWYGSLINRLEENVVNENEIVVGMGVTFYYWSDRHAYEVVKVVNQKNVIIRELDHKCIGGAYSNEWELSSNENNPLIELAFRYNKWHRVYRATYNDYVERKEKYIEKYKYNEKAFDFDFMLKNKLSSDSEIEQVKNGGSIVKYQKLECGIRFGKAEYYYDYSF